MKKSLRNLGLLGLTTGLLATAGQAATIVTVPAGDISVDTSWVNDNEYVLQGLVFVTNGATLTIEKGTIIRGQPVSGSEENDPGTLVVTRDGMINAKGTSSEPIIFTTAALAGVDGYADANSDGKADRWAGSGTFHDANPLSNPLPLKNANGTSNKELCGGLVLLGNAPTNIANVGGLQMGERYIEGLPQDSRGVYGGHNPNDNSGSIAFWSIRHTGGFISPANDINGLSLGAVGFGTKIEYIETYCAGDDSIEFFGGTVNTRYMVAAFYGDDGFDMDEGFTGLGQFWFLLGSDQTGDAGFEWDGDHFSDTENEAGLVNSLRIPRTYATIYNITAIGNGSGRVKRGITARHNFGGLIQNSIFTEFADRAIKVGDGETDTLARMNAGELLFNRNVWWNFKYDSGTSTWTNTAAGLANSATEQRLWDGTDAMQLNVIADPGFGTINRTVGPINPRPLNAGGDAAAVLGNLAPYTSTFFVSATYKGAFSTNPATRLWTTGWTALNKRGILAN